MNVSVLAIAALACGMAAAPGCKQPPAGEPAAPTAVVARYGATRWLPAHPSYVLAAPTFRDAQRSLREIIEVFGMPVGLEVSEIGRDLARVLAVDPLSPEAVAAIGVDLDGGFALFSEGLTPTYVVHLAAPEQMQAFLERERERGLVTQSVMVDQVEIFTAALGPEVSLSWAIVDGWMWLHLTPPFARNEGTTWFTSSYRPDAPAWVGDWAWAEGMGKLARPSVVGFIDTEALLGRFVARVPDAMQCAKLLAPVQRAAIAIETDGRSAGARIALDVGAAAGAIAGAQLPVPEGYPAIAAAAPLAVQWNLDLLALRGWLQPCLASLRADLGVLDPFGVRAGRAALLALDADDKKGAGLVALDLAHAKFFAAQLDEVPLRSTLERARTFGPHAGHSLSIPFVASVDYVLTEKLGLVAMGDGLLARVVGSGATVAGPLAAIDVIPNGLSAEAWLTLAELIGVPRAERVVERMRAWKDGHLRLELEGQELVLIAAGTRR